MAGSENINEVIGAIYDAVIDPSLWSEALLRTSHALGADGIVLADIVQIPEQGRKLIPLASAIENMDLAGLSAYFDRFHELETKAQTMVDQNSRAIIENSENPYEHKAISLDEFYDANHPDYLEFQRFMRSLGLPYRVGTALNTDSWNIDRTCLLYARKPDLTAPQTQNLLKCILPHLAKARHLSRKVRVKEDGSVTIDHLENIDLAMGIFSALGYPIYLNNAFFALNDRYGLFRFDRLGHMSSPIQPLHEYVAGYMSQQTHHGRFGSRPRKESFAYYLEDFDTTVFVEIGPLKWHQEIGAFPEGTQLIQILDINEVPAQKGRALNRYFSLSKTEFEVAKLILQGYSNTEIAELRGRSLDTVKSQIRSVFQKTNTSGRVELTQLSYTLANTAQMFL